MQKSQAAKGVVVMLIMLFAACTSDQRYKRQIDDNEEYLKTPSLHTISNPFGITLPLQNGYYEILAVTCNGAVGKRLDIRPPTQPLALLNGFIPEYYSDDSAIIKLKNSTQSRDLWLQVIAVMKSNGYPIALLQDAKQSLDTDWILWNRTDEDKHYSGRYHISLVTHSHQTSLQVTSLDLRQHGKSVTNHMLVQHYTVEMLNSITSGLQQLNYERANRFVQSKTANLSLQSGADENGLPLLVVHLPYNTVWTDLPEVLSRIGMKIKDSNSQLGTALVIYDALDSSTWRDLGAKDPYLRNGDYKLQIGNLGNRSTLQFSDLKGHTITKSQNDALAMMLQSVFNQSSTR